MPTCERCNYTSPEQLDMLDTSDFDVLRRDFITFYSRAERKHHTYCNKCFYGGRDPYQQQVQQQHAGHVISTITVPHNMGGGNEPVEM